MATHPFAFSEGPDGSGSSYTTNVTNNGTTVEITITETTPDLHYYCENHPGMGSSAEVSHISFGNFILSNGNETNILNDIELLNLTIKQLIYLVITVGKFLQIPIVSIILMVLGLKITLIYQQVVQ